MTSLTLYGAPISPFVRKARLALKHKNVSYELVPVIPVGDDQPAAFKTNSPLGKIPLLQVGDAWLPDSSIICAWLERAHPEQPLVPADPVAAARTLWYEEYADGHMSGVVGPHMFAEIVLAPLIFKRETNQDEVDTAINTELPPIFDYLEGELKTNYLLGSELTLADLAVGSMFVTLLHCDHQCDKKRWPALSAYVDKLLSSELFSPIIEEEKQMLAAMKGG